MTTKQQDTAGNMERPLGGGSTEERKPYRLVRGHYSRREGNEVARRDNETGAPIGGTARPYVHYQAKTLENPHTRNEIILSPREAAALGRRVVPLFRAEVQTGTVEYYDPEKLVPPKSIEELIALGMAVTGAKAFGEFRQEVFKSGHLSHLNSIPDKKPELLGHLRKVQAKAEGGTDRLAKRPTPPEQ